MPPRFAYWTILVGGLPTAFRSAERDELMPTFKRLQEKQPDAEMRWFARGKLWSSPEEASADTRGRSADADRAARGRNWRPGGTHQDPRQPYKDAKKRGNQERRQQRFDRKQDKDQVTRPNAQGSMPKGDRRPRQDQGARPEWKRDRPEGARPKGPGAEGRSHRPEWKKDRPEGARPAWSGDKPKWESRPKGNDREHRPLPTSDGAKPKWGDKPAWKRDAAASQRSDVRGPKPEWRGAKPEWKKDRPEGARPKWSGDKPAWKRDHATNQKPDVRSPKPEWRGEKPKWEAKPRPEGASQRPQSARPKWGPPRADRGPRPTGPRGPKR